MVTSILLFLLAIALAVIGMLLQAAEDIGGPLLGVIGTLTRKMGPGVTYDPPRTSRAPRYFFGTALLLLAGAIWRIFS